MKFLSKKHEELNKNLVKEIQELFELFRSSFGPNGKGKCINNSRRIGIHISTSSRFVVKNLLEKKALFPTLHLFLNDYRDSVNGELCILLNQALTLTKMTEMLANNFVKILSKLREKIYSSIFFDLFLESVEIGDAMIIQPNLHEADLNYFRQFLFSFFSTKMNLSLSKFFSNQIIFIVQNSIVHEINDNGKNGIFFKKIQTLYDYFDFFFIALEGFKNADLSSITPEKGLFVEGQLATKNEISSVKGRSGLILLKEIDSIDYEYKIKIENAENTILQLSKKKENIEIFVKMLQKNNIRTLLVERSLDSQLLDMLSRNNFIVLQYVSSEIDKFANFFGLLPMLIYQKSHFSFRKIDGKFLNFDRNVLLVKEVELRKYGSSSYLKVIPLVKEEIFSMVLLFGSISLSNYYRDIIRTCLEKLKEDKTDERVHEVKIMTNWISKNYHLFIIDDHIEPTELGEKKIEHTKSLISGGGSMETRIALLLDNPKIWNREKLSFDERYVLNVLSSSFKSVVLCLLKNEFHSSRKVFAHFLNIYNSHLDSLKKNRINHTGIIFLNHCLSGKVEKEIEDLTIIEDVMKFGILELMNEKLLLFSDFVDLLLNMFSISAVIFTHQKNLQPKEM